MSREITVWQPLFLLGTVGIFAVLTLSGQEQEREQIIGMRQHLRRLLHGLVLSTGFRLCRITPFERELRRWELEHDDFYFLQVGAHNGVTSDPFQRFIAENLWTCILVEPQAAHFNVLQAIYCDREKIFCRKVAIGDPSQPMVMYRVRDDAAGVPYWASQLASMRYEVIASHESDIPNLRELIVADQVDCTTVASLVSDHHFPRLDLLAVDAEGYDFEVIKQIDQLPWMPKFIYYENRHLSADEHQASLSFLTERGYKILAVNAGDTFAIGTRNIS